MFLRRIASATRPPIFPSSTATNPALNNPISGWYRMYGGGNAVKSNFANISADRQQSQRAGPELVNEAIRSSSIILIDERGTKVGQRQLKEVLQSLDRNAFSLVQVGTASNAYESSSSPLSSLPTIKTPATSSDIPVCRIFSRKVLVEQRRKQAEQEKRQRRLNREKEIRFNESITEHDLLIKMRHIRELLLKGYHIRVVQVGKKQSYARHLTQPDIDRRKMELIREHLCAKSSGQECEYACGAKVEIDVKVLNDGISLSMTLRPPQS